MSSCLLSPPHSMSLSFICSQAEIWGSSLDIWNQDDTFSVSCLHRLSFFAIFVTFLLHTVVRNQAMIQMSQVWFNLPSVPPQGKYMDRAAANSTQILYYYLGELTTQITASKKLPLPLSFSGKQYSGTGFRCSPNTASVNQGCSTPSIPPLKYTR